MTRPEQKAGSAFCDLADHLDSRREALLHCWRQAVQADPELPTPASLSMAEFDDHVPVLLDAYCRALRSLLGAGHHAKPQEGQKEGVEHGLLRWQQGCRLRELAREWGHLHRCLIEELEGYAQAHPSEDRGVVATARHVWSELCWQGVAASAAEYHRLQQTEAAARVCELDVALKQLRELERRRGEALREAAHDLRGKVSVVSTATAVLVRTGVPEQTRDQALGLLEKNVDSLRGLLNDLMDLARLEAGCEYLEVEQFDAARLLAEVCNNHQPFAAERGLYLRGEGPPSLPVEGDPGKVRRIAQNLVLNALKYTERGGVTVAWDAGEGPRWVFSVQDTGPGFQTGPSAPLAGVLKEATAAGKEAREGTSQAGDADLIPPEECDTPPKAVTSPAHGEGIGLSIVKRLCELLDGGLELESEQGKGSTFRVKLPRGYNNA